MFLYRRSKIFWVGFQENKKRKGKSLHKFLGLSFPVTDRQTAELLLANYRMKQIHQELGIEKSDPVPVEKFYFDYRRYCDRNKNRSTVQSDTYRLKNWLRFLEEKRIDSMSAITKQEMTSFVNSLHCSNATINRYVSLIRASIRWGVDQGTLKTNPLSGYRRLAESRPTKPAEVHVNDWKALMSINDAKFKLFLQITYYTLARKSEVSNLVWGDINSKRRTITFRQTKTKTDRVIPICDQLYQVLVNHKAPTEVHDKIFPWEPAYVSRKFQRLRDKLKLSLRGLHEFRHARASELLRKGANPRAVQELLGHKTSKTTMEIYAQVSLDGLREVVTKL